MKMVKSRMLKMSLDDNGSYLGHDRGCFFIRNMKKGTVDRFPHFEMEIGEAVLREGNYVSVDALVDLALWNIDTFIMTQRNRVVAILKSLEDDSHVKTRLCQYEAYKNDKGISIAKQIVLAKLEGQNKVLTKYGLKLNDENILNMIESVNSESVESVRKRLISIEGKYSELYFNQVFSLFPEKFRPNKRTGFKAYDGINNVFNFGYYVLKCKIHKALIKARLEPYLGFLHSIQYGKPSLVCDFMELYRYLIDDFLIERCQKYHKSDFVFVTELMMHLKKYRKVIHLCDYETDELAKDLNVFFERVVNVPRIKHGKMQTVETLINEEALLFAKYLRNEREAWIPRHPEIDEKL